ncbi:MAG: hypothetical protein RLZZ385_2662 [Pseudomonadota bacterium]|jgi:putative transposase
MARQRRLFLTGRPYFILLEGHNGNHCFYDEACYRYYLTRLQHCLVHYQVAMHAYVLLPNEIQLLLTPGTPTGISQLMKMVGGAYVQYFNHRFERSGSLWKGRFKSCMVNSGQAFLDSQKYIELAPQRNGLGNHPGEYHWSSYCINAFGGHGRLLTAHEAYRTAAWPAGNRFHHYRRFIAAGFADGRLRELESALRTGQARLDPAAAGPDIKAIKKCRYTPMHSTSITRQSRDSDRHEQRFFYPFL